MRSGLANFGDWEMAWSPPRDPLATPDSPSVVYRDIPIVSLTGSWTIDAIRSALAAHKIGQFGPAASLVDDVFGDDRVQATLGSRTGALFGQQSIHERGVADVDGSCEEAWRKQWHLIMSSGVCHELKRWAIMLGFSVAEILYDTTVTPWRQYLKPWHSRNIYYRWDIRKLVAITLDGPEIIEPGNGKWFVHAPFGEYRGWIHASIRAIADKWFIKNLAWRDWARFNERHGLPLIKAMVPAAGDAKQKATFVDQMGTIGQEAVVGLPQMVDGTGYDIQLLEARDRAWETFKGAVEGADRSIILTIKSQNLTTEVAEGSFAAARQHGNVEQVTLEFDNATFASDFYDQVARPFALFNFGDADAATRSSWNVVPEEDRAASAKTLLDLSTAMLNLKNAGVELDIEKMAVRYGVPMSASASAQRIGQIYEYHINAGIPTLNEVRQSLGLPPVDGGDEPTQPPAHVTEQVGEDPSDAPSE